MKKARGKESEKKLEICSIECNGTNMYNTTINGFNRIKNKIRDEKKLNYFMVVLPFHFNAS